MFIAITASVYPDINRHHAGKNPPLAIFGGLVGFENFLPIHILFALYGKFVFHGIEFDVLHKSPMPLEGKEVTLNLSANVSDKFVSTEIWTLKRQGWHLELANFSHYGFVLLDIF